QALLLEYLYDLLEGHERESVQTHLASCAGCQAALERAKRQQRLLATAAKSEFAGVQFQAPAVIDPAPATMPMPVRKPRPSFRRFALAAAVLLALGLGGAGIWVNNDYATARSAVEDHQVAVAGLQKQTKQIEESIHQGPAEQANKLAEVEPKINEMQFLLEVIGPKTMQP